MKKRVYLWGGIGIILVAVILVVFLVVIPNGSKNLLVGCEYKLDISETESYKISFRKDTVVLYHDYMKKNSLSPSGYSKDTDKSDWQEFDCEYEYDGCFDISGLPYYYSIDPDTKGITFTNIEFMSISKDWDFFLKLK